MLYRTAGLIDERLQAGHTGADLIAALEEFAIESSILKVASTETLDFVVDENVQIHGGNGFVRDYPAERHYRDARVNRIFEGTNEINRLLIPGMLVRRALKGGLPLIPAAKNLMDELLSPPSLEPPSEAPLDAERRAVTAIKKVALMVLGTALQTFGEKLTDEQEVLMAAADIIIDAYAVRKRGRCAHSRPAILRQPEAPQRNVRAPRRRRAGVRSGCCRTGRAVRKDGAGRHGGWRRSSARCSRP